MRSPCPRERPDAGTVTAELAVVLPAVLLVLAALPRRAPRRRGAGAARRRGGGGEPERRPWRSRAVAIGRAVAAGAGSVRLERRSGLICARAAAPARLLGRCRPGGRHGLRARTVSGRVRRRARRRCSRSAVVVAMLVLLAGLVPVVVLLGAHQRAAAAADAAALAGADTALGAIAGIPCERAGEVARADGARLLRCRQTGTDVRVDVAVPALGLALPAAALAGAAGPVTGGDVAQGVRRRCVWCAGSAARTALEPFEEGGPCPARRSW